MKNGTTKKTDRLNFKADPRNPNRMSVADKGRMSRSLEEFGDLGGIVLNRRTGLLVGGHQRASILDGCDFFVTDLPKPEKDGTVARGYIVRGGVRYSVRVVDWEESKAHAALLAANRFGRVGQDDEELLRGLLDELTESDISTDLTGFDEKALSAMIGEQGGKDGSASSLEEDFSVEKMCIIVTAKTTEEQRSVFEELKKRGFSCRLSSM